MRKWSCKLQNKLEIRKALLKKREAISFLERKEAAEKAALHFQNAPFFSLRNFACYFAQPNEFDCTPLIESIWSANKLCYLPVLTGS